MYPSLEDWYRQFGILDSVIRFEKKISESLVDTFRYYDEMAELNQLKVIRAMQKHGLSDRHFGATTGYGYNDIGRDTLEEVYASVFNTEAALVRPQIISGTHALTVALSGNLRPGDEILSVYGKPYDTLEGVIGIRPTRGSLAEFGITYKQVDRLANHEIDFKGIEDNIHDKTKLILIQRSKGYELRPTLSIDQIEQIIKCVRNIKADVIVMVDNCYGEFVEALEPTEVGADLVVGSLIKNPGGGLAPIGGYIVGKEQYVDNAAFRLTAPGLGKEVGPTLGITEKFFQGLFLAPQVVGSAIKGAIFTASLFHQLGFVTDPKPNEKRCDIIQAIQLNAPQRVIAFCEGIQMAAPVDSFVTPVPWAMPGYDSEVIMAAGAFVQGSSIELSADAPIKPPYNVFLQGGLTYAHAKLGGLMALNQLVKKGLIVLNENNYQN